MKVFLSSTYVDLEHHRRAAAEAIERIGYQGIRMEVFGARPAEATEASLDEVEKCDLFVGVYAHRYGHVPADLEMSITEAEYRRARELGKRIFCFLVDEEFPWPPKMIESGPDGERLDRLKRTIRESVVTDVFTSPEDLAMKIATSITRDLPEFGDVVERDVEQAAAVCYRGAGDDLEFLLIRTSGRRWLFPKGNIDAGESEWRAAEREAFEEAGVFGDVQKERLTTFRHHKRDLKREGTELTVAAYLLRVHSTRKPREPHRSPTWFSPEGAQEALAEDREYEYADEVRRVIRAARDAIG